MEDWYKKYAEDMRKNAEELQRMYKESDGKILEAIAAQWHTREREVFAYLEEMFEAQERYGTGFYNDTEWVEAYESLRKLVERRLMDKQKVDQTPLEEMLETYSLDRT